MATRIAGASRQTPIVVIALESDSSEIVTDKRRRRRTAPPARAGMIGVVVQS